MTDELMHAISAKLDHLVRLTAINTVKGLKPNEAIAILGGAGLNRNLIASVVGTTPATVSVRLSEAKAKKTRASKTAK